MGFGGIAPSGNSFFNGMGGNTTGVDPTLATAPTGAGMTPGGNPYAMPVNMLAALYGVGNPAQTAWAGKQLSLRFGGDGNTMPDAANAAINQYSQDPNVTGAMKLFLNGAGANQIMQAMTGPSGNGLQGVDPGAWMTQLNEMRNTMNASGLTGDPTHGYPANSPFNPQNNQSPFFNGSSQPQFSDPNAVSASNPSGAVSVNGSAVGGNWSNGGSSTGTQGPVTPGTGTTGGAGTQLSPGDIAFQNQLRQNAMDSQTTNPSGTNTWGIQNGTASNLQQAFGGGVIAPSTTAPAGIAPTASVPPSAVPPSAPPVNQTTANAAPVSNGPPPGANIATDPTTAGGVFGGALGGAAPGITPAAPPPVAPSAAGPSYFGGALAPKPAPAAPVAPAAPTYGQAGWDYGAHNQLAPGDAGFNPNYKGG